MEAVAAAAPPEEPGLPPREPGVPLVPIDRVPVFTSGETHDTPVFDRNDLRAGDTIVGPALIREANATTMIEPHWSASVTATNGWCSTVPRPSLAQMTARIRITPIPFCWSFSATSS